MAPRRFQDPGTSIYSYWNHVLVRCPRCKSCAEVRRTGSPLFGPARLTCLACSYTAQAGQEAGSRPSLLWRGATRGYIRRRCGHCGRWLPNTLTRRRRAQLAQPVRVFCPGCRHTTDVTAEYLSPLSDEPLDPVFGLPLWLQMPFKGKLLWAYNPEHLRFIKDFVSASLRDKALYHRSAASRLPSWIKSAKHREDLLRAITRLEALL